MPKFFSDSIFFWTQHFFRIQNFFRPTFFSDPTFFWTKDCIWPKTFLGQKIFLVPNFFRPKIFFKPKIFFQPKLFQTQIFFTFIFGLPFFRPKTMFGGRKQSFWTLSFLNWQRAKVLLKLEFDTEDQVLFKYKTETKTGGKWDRNMSYFSRASETEIYCTLVS